MKNSGKNIKYRDILFETSIDKIKLKKSVCF